MDSSDTRTRDFPCESCGADLAYEPGASELACPYCGFRVSIGDASDTAIRERDLEAMLTKLAEQRAEGRVDEPDTLELSCPSCSATVVFQGALTAQDCAWCGSPIQRADVHRAASRIAVDAVLPFQLEPERARAAVSRWLQKLWFAPDSFRAKRVPERVQSIYLPYWTFDALTFTRYQGRYKTGSGKNERWRRKSGSFPRSFNDIAVVADAALAGRRSEALEPWPFHRAVAYRPEYLVGHAAKTYDLSLVDGWKRARERMERDLESQARRGIGGGSPRVDSCHTRWEALTYKHVLLPVFLLGIRHGDRIYHLVVNGATGAVSGARPFSRLKLALPGAALLAAGALYWWLGEQLRP